MYVNVPNINCILGDNLTAFAPHTIGIPLGKDKEPKKNRAHRAPEYEQSSGAGDTRLTYGRKRKQY